MIPLPWHVNRDDPHHPIVSYTGTGEARAVRLFVRDACACDATIRLGRVTRGERGRVCLCGVDIESALMSLAWIDGSGGDEYLWRFTV